MLGKAHRGIPERQPPLEMELVTLVLALLPRQRSNLLQDNPC